MKLFLEFTPKFTWELAIEKLIEQGISDNIFVLSIPGNDYALTYQVHDYEHIKSGFPINRKKETNTLFTINALNYIIKTINSGVVDTSISIPWQHYQNCILMLENGILREIPTKLYTIYKQ